MPVELVGFLFDFSACLQAIAKFDGSLRNVSVTTSNEQCLACEQQGSFVLQIVF
jgi:hypothetical protein